ncbi:hypothetical protein [Microbacterium sp. GXF7504]
MTSATTGTSRTRGVFLPTLVKQCWGFMIGSLLFGLSTTPGLSELLGSNGANLMCFVGAWFFTGAGFIQLLLSGAVSVPVPYPPGRMVRAEWLTASSQSFGTLLFNVSTTAALTAKSVSAQDDFVWAPDAGGSVAFLVSGAMAFVAYAHANRRAVDLGDKNWWSTLVNWIGCVAFGVSAIGAYILPDGSGLNDVLAQWGTFIGAICFFLASLIVLPDATRAARAAATR